MPRQLDAGQLDAGQLDAGSRQLDARMNDSSGSQMDHLKNLIGQLIYLQQHYYSKALMSSHGSIRKLLAQPLIRLTTG